MNTIRCSAIGLLLLTSALASPGFDHNLNNIGPGVQGRKANNLNLDTLKEKVKGIDIPAVGDIGNIGAQDKQAQGVDINGLLNGQANQPQPQAAGAGQPIDINSLLNGAASQSKNQPSQPQITQPPQAAGVGIPNIGDLASLQKGQQGGFGADNGIAALLGGNKGQGNGGKGQGNGGQGNGVEIVQVKETIILNNGGGGGGGGGGGKNVTVTQEALVNNTVTMTITDKVTEKITETVQAAAVAASTVTITAGAPAAAAAGQTVTITESVRFLPPSLFFYSSSTHLTPLSSLPLAVRIPSQLTRELNRSAQTPEHHSPCKQTPPPLPPPLP
ncbi:hypothetical protein BDV96DRAFT_377720 [Lophiotrema nucula]|uniref:Uncharacterized protein n=1 Tax=Lophiotrema nucula TaxID=690887 RepID=A0A6A5ZH58_9PLEO|nr:hypothetical protein BDV96DRAFT_377720 [Lophiotrema nucula]